MSGSVQEGKFLRGKDAIQEKCRGRFERVEEEVVEKKGEGQRRDL